MGKTGYIKTLTAISVSLALILGVIATSVAAEVSDCSEADSSSAVRKSSDNSYSAVRQSYGETLYTAPETVLSEKEITCSKGTELNFDVYCEEAAIYRLAFCYRGLEKQETEIAVLIDEEYPFVEAESIKLPTYWTDDGIPRVDADGNEFAPKQQISEEYVSGCACDNSGKTDEPYLFRLTQGTHKITVKFTAGSCLLKSLSLKAQEEIPAYSAAVDLKAAEKSEDINDVITLEGEAAYLKSSASLIPRSDDASADVSPSNSKNALINYIGGSNWSGQNDTISWKFSVKQSGYYSLAFLYRQNQVLGGFSYRNLMIDGATPFEEASSLKFTYKSSWQYSEFVDGEEVPYLIYLEEGEHTLSLSVTTGELADIYNRLSDVTADLGDLYIDITMVVGETVDVSRSYELFNQIPQFNERLSAAADELNSIASALEKLQEKKGGSNISTINSAVETLQKMYDNPYYAHKYKSAYYTAYTNLSALLGTITDMPLDIDRIFIIGKGANFEKPTASIAEKLIFSAKRFLFSFLGDYSDEKSDGADDDELTLWVNWGRDQTQVLDAMIQSEFTAEYGIPVNVKLVNATLIQAILSGDGPDVMLQMSRTEPVNLAMRNALIDLSGFDDFEEVIDRFSDGATIPFEYGGGTYALPDTMSFYVMFARTDVLEEMGLEIPKTWQEFIHTMTVLQHSNLQVSLPYTQIADSTTVNVGVGGLTLYPTLLAQNNLSLYNSDLSASTLTNEPQIAVFNDWVEFYTKYKVPKTMDFYNRFRIGSAPLGIATYTLYTQLKAAAPEIDGRWQIALIPGVQNKDGSVNHASAMSGTGCAITKLSKNPEKAWEFLKWWTSVETQNNYSDNLEALLGPLGRVATSNIEALNNMVWDDESLEILNSQIECGVQIPEIPGGYYTARGIDQAFWNVVEQNENPTDMLLEWGAVVDGEIQRKRSEYVN